MKKGNLVKCMKTSRQGIVVDVSPYTYWVEARPIKIVETKRAKIVDNSGFFYANKEDIKIVDEA
tara:strand:+ start:317 stop:508 length:192 start_codon:yes stop_codon:yes gene_type:complete